ncbi:MAG: hypothetical protein MJD61_20225 [Proteobacteria bacterium]|nr:hypothetical protein [Pseudomonadota bacterium]
MDSNRWHSSARMRGVCLLRHTCGAATLLVVLVASGCIENAGFVLGPGAAGQPAHGSGRPQIQSPAVGFRILPGPGLRVAGAQQFTVEGPAPEATHWGVSRSWTPYDGALGGADLAVASAVGASVSFSLSAMPAAATSYTVTASDGTLSDSVTFQVVEPATVSPIRFASPGSVPIWVHVVVPQSLDPATHLLVALHDDGRRGGDYCLDWLDWAGSQNYAIVCPEFDEATWPSRRAYHLGNVFTGSDGAGMVHPQERWAFTVVENLLDHVRRSLALTDARFDAWGHGAGAQFAHRMVLFRSNMPVRYVIASGAGWYTTADLDLDFPYGLRHLDPGLSFSHQDLLDYTNQHLVLVRGELDNGQPPDLRVSGPANQQGLSRFERAEHMLRTGELANPNLNWLMATVWGVGYDRAVMSYVAQELLANQLVALPFH